MMKGGGGGRPEGSVFVLRRLENIQIHLVRVFWMLRSGPELMTWNRRRRAGMACRRALSSAGNGIGSA